MSECHRKYCYGCGRSSETVLAFFSESQRETITETITGYYHGIWWGIEINHHNGTHTPTYGYLKKDVRSNSDLDKTIKEIKSYINKRKNV